VAHEVRAFLRREERHRDSHEVNDLVKGAWARRAKKGFELREGQLNGVEVRAVGWQEPEMGARAREGRGHGGVLVHGEVIEDDDIAGPERRHEDLFDIGEKRGGIDRAVEDGGGAEAIHAESRDDRVGLPMTQRRVIAQADAARAATIATQEIRRDPGLIEEDVVPRVAQLEDVLPVPPRRRDIRSALFVGVHRFF